MFRIKSISIYSLLFRCLHQQHNGELEDFIAATEERAETLMGEAESDSTADPNKIAR